MRIQSSSLGESIVLTLKKHGTIPIEFLAKLQNRGSSEIEDYLVTLEREGIIVREGDTVSLQKDDVARPVNTAAS